MSVVLSIIVPANRKRLTNLTTRQQHAISVVLPRSPHVKSTNQAFRHACEYVWPEEKTNLESAEISGDLPPKRDEEQGG
jgi:hypothetical protein